MLCLQWRDQRGRWNSSLWDAGRAGSKNWVCDKITVACIGTAALPKRQADSEAGGSGAAAAEWPDPVRYGALAHHAHEFNEVQWGIHTNFPSFYYILHDILHDILQRWLPIWSLPWKRPKPMKSGMISWNTMNSGVPKSVLAKDSYIKIISEFMENHESPYMNSWKKHMI